MKLGGCRVIIKCGKKVYEDGHSVSEDGKEVTCNIESVPDKNFWIEYSRDLNYGPPNTQLTADIYFGGVFAGGWVAPDPSPGSKTVVGDPWVSKVGDNYHRFAFSVPTLIDGETPSANPDLLGEISIQLGFIANARVVKELPPKSPPPIGPVKVNGRDKKPGVHCAGPTWKLSTCAKECTGPVLSGDVQGGTLVFRFNCHSKESRRVRQSSRLLAKGSDAPPLPKPEDMEGVVPAGQVLTGRAEVSSPSRPQPRSPTPLSYADRESSVLSEKRKRPVPQPTEQKGQPLTSFDAERPQKVPRLTGNADRGGVVSKVKGEEGGSVPKVNGEIGRAMANGLEELKAKEKELDEKISQLEKEREHLRDQLAGFQTPGIGRGTASPRPGVKTEREPMGLPVTPEVIDLTD